MAQESECMVLLRQLDLYKYYPGKMQREDVVCLLSNEIDEKNIEKTEDLGMTFLHRLLNCNYEARDLEIVAESKSQLKEEKVVNLCPTTSKLSKRKQLISRPAESRSNAIHPLDVVIAVFVCADPILQQDIATLLWKCKLAIPFITSINQSGTPFVHVWPLRSIYAKWEAVKDGKLINEEDCVLAPPFFTIGFMRFESTDVTKSMTINTLLSDTDKIHPIFYHRNSRGSTKKRLLADGMVEINWYLPRSSGETLCSEPITVLNLRGNALMYERQRRILMEMASICCIVCSSKELDNEEVDNIVETIVNLKKKVFIITYDEKEHKGIPTIQIDDDVTIFNKESLNDAELKEKLRCRLKELQLKDSFQRISIDSFLWKDIIVDLERQEIRDGIKYAEKIMTSLRSLPTESRKDKLLPLHQSLWSNWVETDKEMHRLKKRPKSKDIQEYRDKLATEKIDKRGEQFKILQSGLSEAISIFLKALDTEDKTTRGVCITWLKIQLNKLARMELGLILENESAMHDRKELDKIEELKNKSHIGIEHFFRELGQIYESIAAQPPNKRYDIGYDLPLLAARFLLDGNSLEIYDGDAGAVPITWVSAVFDSLLEIVKIKTSCKNPKCTVLTVYGMQSSGKSTLLNTMFGCQFNVGAGRCTRGAQIHTFKVSLERMNVDYIIVVDTEGVRSPEVPEEIRRQRDNEITTFVIGLGQKTLINLMGENPVYLTDVLPIAVRAFLRMDCVGLKPSCAIVYQNVDPQSRVDMSSQNCKLQEELDAHTLSVCQMEKKERRSFQDVIQFDVKNDIHYIPGLWEGELPMATVSQGYSKYTMKLKYSLQQFFRQCTSQDLTTYSAHVRSLWTAITKDDFVYFFRNTLETEARERLDKCWCDCVWKLRMEAKKCASNTHTDIMNCPDSDKLGEISASCRENIIAHIMSTYKSLEKELTTFFEKTEQKYKQYMIQWNASSIDGLTRTRDELIGDLKLDIGRLRRLKESQLLVEKEVKVFKDRIRNEIIQYFKEEGKQTSDIDDEVPTWKIRHKFEDKWKEWSNTVKTIGDKHERRNNVALEAVNILREKFSSHESLVFQKADLILSGTILEFELQQSHLIKDTKDVTQNVLNSARAIVQRTTEHVRKRLNELTQDPSPYKKGSIEEIIELVATNEKEIETMGVKTTKEFEIESSVAVVSIAISAFSNSENTFLDSFDPIRLLEQEKETFYILFETNYRMTSFTLSFAKRVSDLCTTAIQNKLNTDIAGEVANDMRSIVYMKELNNKQSFIYTILCQMATERIFDSFMDYIKNPTETIDHWLGRYVDKYASANSSNTFTLRALIDRLVRDHVKTLMIYAKDTERQLEGRTDHVENTIQTANVPVKLWVKEFTQMASKTFEVNKIRNLSDIFGEKMLDFQHFCVELLNQLEITSPNFDDLTTKGKASYETMRGNVVKSLKDLVVGCTVACPFCGELCISSLPVHEDGLHETPVHRPQGCYGYRNISTNILLHDSCQKLVHGSMKFHNEMTNEQFVPYKDYQTIYKDWKIPGDPNPLTSSFWEWFMFNYITDLETKHNAKRPDMPKEWKYYTEDGEKEKLNIAIKTKRTFPIPKIG